MAVTRCAVAGLFAAAAALLLHGRTQPTPVFAGEAWNVQTAAHKMDERQTWWMQWPKAQRDHDTACVSCHTVLPYAMARVSLRKSLHESTPSQPEQIMLGYIDRRVNGWAEMEPFYNDAKSGPRKSVESRGSEAVLNALVLARYASASGHLTPEARKALDIMWSSQLHEGDAAGAWEWLNFHYAPWESEISQYYGAALGAVAAGIAPDQYVNTPEIQPGVEALRRYLATNYEAQPLVNKVVVLWASSQLPGLLSVTQKDALARELFALQLPDGGWNVAAMGKFQRRDGTALDTRSDGYATGLIVFALREAGYPASRPEIKRGVAWLIANQDKADGHWSATSLNKERDPKSDPAAFMSDAATGFAVLALESDQR